MFTVQSNKSNTFVQTTEAMEAVNIPLKLYTSPQPVVSFIVSVDHVNVCDLIGAQVKPGPDWCYRNREYSVGTITECSDNREFDCLVQWNPDDNLSYYYRWGTNGKYELELVL